MKWNDPYYYVQGNLRYKLFYSIFAFMIPNYIHEQIVARIKSMDKDCYNNGVCKLCGCATTALQMANKACEKPCYPKIQSKKDWQAMKQGFLLLSDKIVWELVDGKFKIVKQ